MKMMTDTELFEVQRMLVRLVEAAREGGYYLSVYYVGDSPYPIVSAVPVDAAHGTTL